MSQKEGRNVKKFSSARSCVKETCDEKEMFLYDKRIP